MSESNSSTVTITWISPLDENNLPHKVNLEYSYTHRSNKETFSQIVSCTSWTVDNLENDQEVNFSLKAINKRGREGPSMDTTCRTKPFSKTTCLLHVVLENFEKKLYFFQ